MFIQVIEGRTNDSEALHRQLEVWERELMPGAVGYLGSTCGCTSQGDCIMVARFESEEAAMRNGARPEQTEWWHQTEALFDGAPRFHETTDIEVMSHGRLDDAHFVQVMDGHVADRARAAELERESDAALAKALTALPRRAHFNVIPYPSEPFPWEPKLVPAESGIRSQPPDSATARLPRRG